MAKEVKLKIGIDTSGLKQATRGASDSSRDIAANYLKSQVKMTNDLERETNKRQKMYEKLFNEKEKLDRREEANAKARGARILHAMGLASQAAGLQKTGYLFRMSGIAGIGTQTIGSMGTASMLAAGAALGGLAIASKVVEVGLEALSSVVTSTAGAFMGAIATLGGARNLQGMIVESASTERLSAGIVANTTERTSTRDVMGLINQLSSSSEFKPEEVATMIRTFVGKTGKVSEARELGSFMTDLATGAGLNPEQAGSILGQLRVQFPEFSMKDTKQAAMNLWGLGKSGAVELKDTESITQALGFARKVNTQNPLQGLNMEMGMVQLAQRFTGGQSADQAVTGVRRLQEEILNLSPGTAKMAKMQGLLGQNFLAHTDTGELVFNNAPHSLAQLSLAAYEGKMPQGLMEERGRKALMGITTGISAQFTPGMSEDQKVSIIENTFRKLQESGMTIDEFDGSVKEVKDTVQYQFKQTFNDLSIQIEGNLLPVLKGLVPVVRELGDMLISKKDDIFNAANMIAKTFLEMVPVIVTVARAMEWLGSGIVDKLGWLVKAGASADYEGKSNTIRALEFDADKDKKWLTDPNLSDDERSKIKQDMAEKNKEILKLNTGRMNDIQTVEQMEKLPGRVEKVLTSLDELQNQAMEMAKKLRENMDQPTNPPAAPNVNSNLANH